MASTFFRPTFPLLGLHFTALSPERAQAVAAQLAKAHRPAAIFTPNAEIAYRAARQPSFAACLRRADLLLPDGVGITLAARLGGGRLFRMPGIDFAEEMLRAAPPGGYRLFLLGGRPGVAAQAGAVLMRHYPRVRICGVQDGYYAVESEEVIAAAVRATRPDLLFVCLGSPRQEEWIMRYRLPCLALGLGGALDVWSGAVERAPRAVRRAGFEWLWRGLHDLRRLPRLLALPAFAGCVLRERLFLGKDRQKSAYR